MSGPLLLDGWALAGAASLLMLNGLLSLWLGLGLEKRLAVAALRTVIQLLALGYVLVPIFRWQNAYAVVAVCIAMVALAAREAVRRVHRTHRGMTTRTLLALLVGTGTTAVCGSAVFIGVQPWWEPRYLIPLIGMILGNGLTGISLGLERCLQLLDENRDRVELLIAFGATRWEAARPVAAESLRTALLPILNSMSAVGLVTVPGMMTGQILGGTPPEIAARYQILIMFLIAAATALGAVLSIVSSLFVLIDRDHMLRVDLIHKRL